MLVALGIENHEKGAYRLVSDLGSLVARMLFLPLEETSRAFFSKSLTNKKSKWSSGLCRCSKYFRIFNCSLYCYEILYLFRLIFRFLRIKLYGTFVKIALRENRCRSGASAFLVLSIRAIFGSERHHRSFSSRCWRLSDIIETSF